ncbi:UDP-glucose--hexose-1-phosphate uridylyltransferase [Gottfriedia acidiceleris]|uniref:Galactose-1-phosphate uridylyltransferase n=1 Tax=Gottfriedia acidiceleris TaxID=371036 RepID=A0ABY4JMJ5_9BACI|nr:UDP-glucose--hexose-1-phosphate uridylyltransferase [Gottfriedia acidiceleris]UPM55063.1 UDP-glucose--hexose-1-phosphate uridylyltransferase [Gottfriedia acidiceleris]
MNIYASIQGLLHQVISVELIPSEDEIYSRNKIMSLLALDAFPNQVTFDRNKDIPDFLEEIAYYAINEGFIKNQTDEIEIFLSELMDIFLPRPSDLNNRFYQKYSKDPITATNYFYKFSQDSNYIKTKDISKNISYKVNTNYGELDITINLSKPEKDPVQIAFERKLKPSTSTYPKCLLCIENEGYSGRIGHPARSNHRMVRVEINDEKWLLQYSPYVYYNEHCILLANTHREMKIDRETFTRLLDFIEKFPHYFIGSNADLPIVGGSILSHDHYQGGNYEFAMAKAVDEYEFKMESFPLISASILKWPVSVIRLRGVNKSDLISASEYILNKWKNYSDPEVNIVAYTGEVRHNTITPIARIKNKNEFEIDLVLRNNRTNEEHPMGIFHPHEDVHHIKKENIGLIEVMGLAVLPARLDREITEIEKYLLGQANEIEPYHLAWVEDMKKRYVGKISTQTVSEIVRNELGRKFLSALEDAGVYKWDQKGLEAFRRFIDIL